jgi:hypothetical protein
MLAILPRETARAHVAEPLVDRKLFLSADAQGLVEVAAAFEDVGDLAHGEGARAHVVTRAVAEFVGAAQSRADRLREIERS